MKTLHGEVLDKYDFQCLANSILEAEKTVKTNPNVLKLVKNLCWWAVQYAYKAEAKDSKLIITRKLIDEYVEAELEIKKDKVPIVKGRSVGPPSTNLQQLPRTKKIDKLLKSKDNGKKAK